MGRSTGSIRSSSITTDVSRIPRGRRCSRTWGRILVEQSVDVRAETLGFDGRCAGEDSDGGFGGDELPLSERGKLADRYAVSRYDERLPPVERAHDLATLIAQLSLCDLPCHWPTVAHVLRSPKLMRPSGRLARRLVASRPRRGRHPLISRGRLSPGCAIGSTSSTEASTWRSFAKPWLETLQRY